MNIKFYSSEKTYRFPLVLDEFRAVVWSAFKFTDADHMTLVSKLWTDSTITISLEENGQVVLAPKNVSKLIRKYGLSSVNNYPIETETIAFTLLEVAAIYMYDSMKYEYWEDTKHVFEIETGEEVEFGSQRWDDIRNYQYYNVIKSIHVGQTMMIYLINHGYPIHLRPSCLFLSTKESDD